MRLLKRHIGLPLKVLVWDHTENVGAAVVCEVYGKLIAFDGKTITLWAWSVPSEPTVKGARTEFVLLRQTVKRGGIIPLIPE